MVKLGQSPQRLVIWTITTIVILLAYVSSISLPLMVRSATQGAYNEIEKLPAGSKVIIESDNKYGLFAAETPGLLAVFRHIMRRNIKFIAVTFRDAFTFTEQFITPGWVKPLLAEYKYQYGVDYAILPLVPGLEQGIAAWSRDISTITAEDFFGTPIKDLPVMSGIKTATDFDLIWLISSGIMTAEGNIRQMAIPYNKPVIAMGTYVMANVWAPWYPGIVKGMIIGGRGGAEYEMLIGAIGAATGRNSAVTMIVLCAFFSLVGGNVMYFVERRKKVAVERKVK